MLFYFQQLNYVNYGNLKHCYCWPLWQAPCLHSASTNLSISQKLGGPRDVTIVLPPNYEANKDKKYPLFVVLDSDYLLHSVLGTIKYGAYFGDDLPEVIIVGINQNKANEREYDSQFDENGLPTGEGAKFFEFLGIELIPFIEKTYRVAPYRMVVGH